MPNIYLDYSLKCINSKPTKGKAPQLEGTFVRREFSLKIEQTVLFIPFFLILLNGYRSRNDVSQANVLQ